MHSLYRAQLALQRLSWLVSPPETIVRLLELVLAPEPAMKDIVALVRTDPGLAVEVLRARPSADRKRRHAVDLPNAVQALGIEGMREMALRAEIRGAVKIVDVPDGAVCSLHARKHPVACASAALELAQLTSYPEPETAYAAGLLSSIGSLALWELFESEVAEMRSRITGQNLARLMEIEREVLGLDHESLGIVMADAWDLPFELHDVIAALYRSAEQIANLSSSGTDAELVAIVRAAWCVAHHAGFPLFSSLRIDDAPSDVSRMLGSLDSTALIESTQNAVGRAAEISRPRAQNAEKAFWTLQRADRELQRRLLSAEQRLRAAESVNSVLQYGLQRLGDGDPLPGMMFHAMESIGFKRICCLEADSASAKLEVKLSSASSGFNRVPEKASIPFPAEKALLGTPVVIRGDDRVPGHQLVLELIGVSSAVIAPLQEIHKGKRVVLCADRGPAGPSPSPGEDHALGIIADQASLLLKFEQLTREKERMATQDPLTGAATRRRMMERLEFLITQSDRTKMPFSLLIMDLDHFKKFNDTMGHQTGDKLLQELVGLLAANVRKGDLVARYGGEEFVVLLPNCNLESAFSVGDDLRGRVYEYGGQNLTTYNSLQVSISMGAAEWKAGETALALIGRADAALYQAKHGGRNRVVRAAA